MLGALPFRPGAELRAHCGGWMRLVDPPPVDEVVLVAMADAWLPPVFSRVATPVAVPTMDLTVHFRSRPGEDSRWCFVEFASPVCRDGYLVETGVVRDVTGRLLADIRQLAVLSDARPPGQIRSSTTTGITPSVTSGYP